MSRLSSLRRGGLIAAALSISLIATGCTPSQSSADAADGDAVLRVGIQKPTSLIPGNSTGLFANTVVGAVFDGLVAFDPVSGQPQNLVAETIESDDQRVWKITLKDGWTFHNGEAVDAEAFARGWNAAVAPENAWVQAKQFANIVGYDAVAPAEGEPTAEVLAGVTVDGPLELTVELVEPDSQFPFLLAKSYYSPIPQAALDDPEAFAKQPIGNGAYRVTEPWTGGAEIVTERYDDYAGGDVLNGGVVFQVYTGNDIAYTDYEAGSVDIVSLNPADIPTAEASYPDLVRRAAVDDWRNYLSLPTYLPGYDDPQIRKALSLAIDRDAIITSLLDGEAHVATDVDIPVSVGYRDDACGELCQYDPERAKQLWDEAGGIPGELRIASVTGTGREIWAEAIARQWSDVFGVEVKLDQVASENTWPGIKSREVQSPVTLGAPAGHPSPIDTLGPSYSSSGSVNGSFYHNDAFDSLLQQAAATGDVEEQNALYNEAKDLVIADMPSILLWTYPSTYVVSERAQACEPDAFNKGEFSQVAVN
ncbi:ABC transporter substrate-binding protein [Microbacterium esteraromaticum]|uniref:peptide ABC transporter substrate-binding protein n=1 Tax=Microbacterium esteraromaticum TaxID=57043 RepID=UPI001C96F7D9|nr:ABC transporter substrate-binding protein [Microbacterium esteraromaticum]MBY6062414.1 ABC transporter substrate-binding protein [Microbacterium esteraromaticum]